MYSVIVRAIDSWNEIQKQLKTTLMRGLSHNIIKTSCPQFLLNHINNFYSP